MFAWILNLSITYVRFASQCLADIIARCIKLINRMKRLLLCAATTIPRSSHIHTTTPTCTDLTEVSIGSKRKVQRKFIVFQPMAFVNVFMYEDHAMVNKSILGLKKNLNFLAHTFGKYI